MERCGRRFASAWLHLSKVCFAHVSGTDLADRLVGLSILENFNRDSVDSIPPKAADLPISHR